MIEMIRHWLAPARRRMALLVAAPLMVVLSLAASACTDAEIDTYLDLALDYLTSPSGAFDAYRGLLGLDSGSGDAGGDDALESAKVIMDIRVADEFVRLGDQAEAQAVQLVRDGNYTEIKAKLDEALENYTRAVERRPEDPTIRMNRARFLARTGQYDSAVEEYDEAIRLNRETPLASEGELLQARAQAVIRGGDAAAGVEGLESAEAAFTEAEEEVPGSFYVERARTRARIVASNQGDEEIPLALADANRAIRAGEEEGSMYALRADLQARVSRREYRVDSQPNEALVTAGQAIQDGERAVELSPDDPYAHYTLGLAYQARADLLRLRSDLDPLAIAASGGVADPEQAISQTVGALQAAEAQTNENSRSTRAVRQDILYQLATSLGTRWGVTDFNGDLVASGEAWEDLAESRRSFGDPFATHAACNAYENYTRAGISTDLLVEDHFLRLNDEGGCIRPQE